MRLGLLRRLSGKAELAENRFGFIIHPSNIGHLYRIFGSLKILAKVLPVTLIEGAIFRLPSFSILQVSFDFGSGKRVHCWGFLCPLLPAQMVSAQEVAISRILSAIEKARGLGCRLIGLGGFTSIIGDGGLQIARRSSLPVTSGNTYTVGVIIQGIKRATERLELDLRQLRVAIIGATGDIGSACSRELIGCCKSMVLVARNEERLERLLTILRRQSNEVEIERRAGKAASSADVVVTVTSALTTVLEPRDLKRGAIVCDASYPANILREIRRIRDDLLVYEGGMVSWPELQEQIPPSNPFWKFNSPIGIHGCFAETLLLALEHMYTSYTIGRGSIDSKAIGSLAHIARKYRFQPAEFWHGNTGYTDQDIDRIKCARAGGRHSVMVNVLPRLS